MIANIKHTILGYNKNEFMPIYYEGRLNNVDQFIIYKLKKAVVPTLMKIDRAFTDH